MRNTTPLESNQDAFNRAWDRLVNRADQKQCDDGVSCLYVKGNNNCVVGDMAPNKLWVGKKAAINSYIDTDKLISSHFKNVSIILLNQLQSIHDGFYGDAKNRLILLAAKHNLQIPQ